MTSTRSLTRSFRLFTVAVRLGIVLTFWPLASWSFQESLPALTPPSTTGLLAANKAPQLKRGQAVGRQAAQKYMGRRPAGEETADEADDSKSGGGDGGKRGFGSKAAHYLALHLGIFPTDDAYRWGATRKTTDVGDWTAGVTYRMGEWVNSMDLNLRVDYMTYSLPEGKSHKLAFLPVIIFPDASSRFPLFFGAGAGVGVFLKQIGGESAMSFDYQLLLGARFFDLLKNTGFFVEAGLKNHILLLSDGQFNGTFVSVGTVFSF